jgi:hypothetical protein
MELWLTITAVVAVAGMGLDLAVGFQPVRKAARNARNRATSRQTRREEPVL